jgi:UDP-glucose 4-epimerase
VTRSLITGGAGLVGSHVADLLLAEQDAQVVVVDDFSRGQHANLEDAARSGRLEVVEGDIRDRRLMRRVMRGVHVVFHQAAIRITQCAADPRLAVDVLVNGTLAVVEAAVDAGVARIVAASSASVYGMADEHPTAEAHHPYNNDTLYGAAKLFNEGLLRSVGAMSGTRAVSLRYFNVYGPRMDASGAYTEVLVRWIERIDRGLPPIIFGDGRDTLDFVHVEDVARANLLAARGATRSHAINIGSGVETSLLDLAEALMRVMGRRLPVEYAPDRPVNAVRRRQADTRRAREELGFEATVPLDEGLSRLVRWWRGRRATESAIG